MSTMSQNKIAGIITTLKKVRQENGLSYQRIIELVEQNGEYVSMSTVKKVFEDGSETFGFQYERTLKPIADAVLGIYSDTAIVSEDEVAALKAIIQYKGERITELEARLEQIEEQYADRLAFLKEQIMKKDERIDRRDQMIERLLAVLISERGFPASEGET